MLVSKAEYGRMHGVSHAAVNKWEKRGLLVMQDGKVDVEKSNPLIARYIDKNDPRTKRGPNKTNRPPVNKASAEDVNETPPSEEGVETDVATGRGKEKPKVEHVHAELIEFLPGESAEEAAERLIGSRVINLDMDVEEARRIKEVYLALLNKLEYEVKSEAVIGMDEAKNVMFDVFRSTRDAWLNWPTKYGALIAADLGIEEADRVVEVLNQYVYKQLAQLGEPDEGAFQTS